MSPAISFEQSQRLPTKVILKSVFDAFLSQYPAQHSPAQPSTAQHSTALVNDFEAVISMQAT